MASNIHKERAEYQAKLRRGQTVWCDFAEQEARTADGFCEFCGSTEHRALTDAPQ